MILKKYTLVLIILFLTKAAFSQSTLYVAPNGSSGNPGTLSSPTTLENAISNISSGGTIYMRGGTYNFSSSVIIQRGNDGSSGARTNLVAYNGETPVLNFSGQSESSSNRGVVLDAFYWHVKGLIIEQAGDNGMLLSGNNNIIEDCIFRENHDTGLQLSRYNTSYNSISEWPSNNLILNCIAHDNSDSDHEDADGFAAKLTCGAGNVFDGCVSYHNIDDGWDLYTKSSTGPIGPVTIVNCIAHDNGVLSDGSTSGSGDKNGYKLGSSSNTVNHIVRRCIAYNNGHHGFTDNGNIGSIEFTNNTSYNNAEYNFHTRDGASHVFKNNVSFGGGHTDRIVGNVSAPNALNDTDTQWPYTASAADFVTTSPGPAANPTSNGFLNLASGSNLIDAGVTATGITYNGSAPDLGAVEYGGSTPNPTTYTLSVSANPSAGGSVSLSPDQSSYDDGETVTLTAAAASGYTFSSWSGDASGSSSTVTITMNSNKSVTANFTANDGGGNDGGGGTPTGPTVRIEDTNSSSAGMCSYDGSLKSYSGADNGNAINLSNSSGQQIVWKVEAMSAGTYELKWRYVNGGSQTATSARLLINGSEVNNSVSFPKTSDKSTFITTTENVSLVNGVNEITLETTQNSEFADIDWLEVTGDNPVAADCSAAIGSGGGNGGGTTTGSVALSASSSANSISLNWTVSNINLAFQEVYRDTDSDPSGRTRIASLGTSERSYTDNSVTSGTTYYYWIKATDTNSEVTNSNSASGTASGSQTATAGIQENGTGFCGVDGTVDSDNSGFTGDGFANTDNESGTGIDWKVNAGSSGSYTLEWRYANGSSTNRQANVLVNGSTAASGVNFASTGSWTSWTTVSTQVSLTSGSNTIRLEAATGEGLANIDYIEITGVSPSAADCNGGGGNTSYTLSTSVSPSAGGSITLNPSGGSYTAGTVVTVTANAASNYVFSYWSGDASGSATTYTITMDGNKSVTANFTDNSGGGGSDNVDFSLVGWATQNGGTTGGEGGPSVIVSSGSELQDAIDLGGPRIIYVQGTITSAPDNKINIKDVSNISILGLGSGAEFNNVGLKIWRASNIIVRNLRIHNVLTGDKDCISIEGPADHIWVDHCELYNEYDGVGKDYYDGLLDSKSDADYITYSWNYLHDSWKTSLNGSSESDDYNRHITYHHNFFENCYSRLPLWRGGQGHIFNNYYKDIYSTAINSRLGACIKIENNYFENVNNPWVSAYSDELGGGEVTGNILVNSPFTYSSDVHELPSCTANVPYSYSGVLNAASSVPNIVTQNAGVGKLNITARTGTSTDGSRNEVAQGLENFEVYQNYPNPFSQSTTFSFRLAKKGKVSIDLYNTLGEHISQVVKGSFDAGYNKVSFDRGKLNPGVYIYVLKSDEGTFRQQLIVK